MAKLNSLSPKIGATHRKKRLGCGRGSGHGETCTRGQKGQRSTSGGTKGPGFEGGQMPLMRRIPKSGFNNTRFTRRFECVSVEQIEKFFEPSVEITPEVMLKRGLICNTKRVKILGNGKLERNFKVSAHSFSESAKKKIEKAGGSAVVLEQKTKNK
jgi:large subunit ribosomal protein L15